MSPLATAVLGLALVVAILGFWTAILIGAVAVVMEILLFVDAGRARP